MKHFILFSIVLFFALTACTDSNQIDEEWKEANIEAYNRAANNPEYRELKTETGPSGVYYKVLNSGEGSEKPFQTSDVKVLYFGKFYDGTYLDSGTTGNNIPVEMSVSSTVRGFSFALQNMVVGDHWEIVVPYYLGYGESGYSADGYTQSIQGYTTLFFDVELKEIIKYP